MNRFFERLWRWPPEKARSNLVAGCVTAIALVVVVFGLRSLIALVVPEPPRLILLMPVILVATLVGGASAGFFSLVLSLLVGGTWIWLEADQPMLSLVVTIMTFGVAAGIIIWIGAHYRSVVQELRTLEERRALLHRELLHRSRNLQMVIQSIVRYTLSGDRAKADEINGRIASLGAASQLLNQSDDQTADLGEILKTEMTAHGIGRFAIDGPRLQLPSMHAKVVALVFHELGTNAAKHGSLSAPEGRVRISWSATDQLVTMQWMELQGPPVVVPSATGFGTVFVERMLESVQGRMSAEYGPEGFCCRIEFRLPTLRLAEASGHSPEVALQTKPAPESGPAA